MKGKTDIILCLHLKVRYSRVFETEFRTPFFDDSSGLPRSDIKVEVAAVGLVGQLHLNKRLSSVRTWLNFSINTNL